MNSIVPINVQIIGGIIIFGLIALYDYNRKKGQSTDFRFKEYLYILLCIFLAGIFGIVHNLITSAISPSYFIYGKGLKVDFEFYPDVVILALTGSAWVGAIYAMGVLWVHGPREKNYKQLIKNLRFPVAFILLFDLLSIIIFLLNPRLFPISIPDVDSRFFNLVAYIHWGTYIGALIGFFYSIYCVWKDDFKPEKH